MLKIHLSRFNRLSNHANRVAAILFIAVFAMLGVALQPMIFDSKVKTDSGALVVPAHERNSVLPQDKNEPLSGVNDEKVRKLDLESKPPNEAETQFITFHSRLKSNDFESAVELYDHIYTGSSLEVSADYRELLLEKASDLIQGNDLSHAIALLNEYLTIYYKDVDALIMLGRAYRDAGSKFAAIKSFQQAYQHEHRLGLSALILNQENTVIGEYIQELRDTNNQQSIVDVYLWLTQSQPDIAGYYIGLANAYTDQQRYAEAMETLRYVQYDVKVGPRARALLKELANKNATRNNS
ncbi:MAG: hypothetical protein QNI91_03880 [Arenicellales bacterium]|nr:hypothetical protein [Arenicellales bacterium]